MTPAVGSSHSSRARLNSDGSTKRARAKKDSVNAPTSSGTAIINISVANKQHNPSSSTTTITSSPSHPQDSSALADELDYITVSASAPRPSLSNSFTYRADKASRILGIKHRRSMEPIPASTRNSIVSTHSVREAAPIASFVPSQPLASLYVVSGLPKSPQTWTLADPDSVLGLHHAEGAVNRWWRPEVLGSTVSPGAGGGKKKKRGKGEETIKGAGALTKQEVGKMLSKALKVRYLSRNIAPTLTLLSFSFPSHGRLRLSLPPYNRLPRSIPSLLRSLLPRRPLLPPRPVTYYVLQ